MSAETILLWAQVLAAFVTALATIALFYVTRVLAIETKRLAVASDQPFVTYRLVSSESGVQAMDQVLQNSGNSVAFDIVAKMSPDLPDPGGKGTRDTTFRKVSMLPPGQELRFTGTMGRFVAEQAFDVEVSWSKKPGSRKREVISYQFAAQDGFKGGWTVKGVHSVATEAEKIRKLMEQRR